MSAAPPPGFILPPNGGTEEEPAMLTTLGRALHRLVFGPWVSEDLARRLEETEEQRTVRGIAERDERYYQMEDEYDREEAGEE